MLLFFEVPRTPATKWEETRTSSEDAPADALKEIHDKFRRSWKYTELYQKLFIDIPDSKERGCRMSFRRLL